MKAPMRRVREMLTGPTAVNSLVVATGNGVSALSGLAATVLVSRAMGPSIYGVFSLALGAATTATTLMDFGLNEGLLRHAARSGAAGDMNATGRFLKAYAQLKTLLFLVVCAAGLGLSSWLAAYVLKFPYPALLRWAIVGALGLNLLTCGRNLLEARQRFLDVSIVTAGSGLLKLIAIATLFWLGRLTPAKTLIVYLYLPAAGLVYALWRLPDIPLRPDGRRSLAPERRELIGFGAWIGFVSICASIAGYLDVTLINRSLDPRAVGLYSAAYRFASVFVAASFPLASVLKARASTFSTVGRLEAYLGKARIMAVLAGFGVLAVWIAAPLVVHVFLGPAYEESIPLLRILSIGTALSFASSPFIMAFYAFGRSRSLAILGPVNLGVLFAALRLLLPRYGIAGAAWAFSLTHAAVFVLLIVLVRVDLAQTHEETAATPNA